MIFVRLPYEYKINSPHSGDEVACLEKHGTHVVCKPEVLYSGLTLLSPYSRHRWYLGQWDGRRLKRMIKIGVGLR